MFRDTQFKGWGFSSKKKPFKLLLNGKGRLLKVLVIQVHIFLWGKKEFTIIPQNPENNLISLRPLSNLGFIFSLAPCFQDTHFSFAREKVRSTFMPVMLTGLNPHIVPLISHLKPLLCSSHPVHVFLWAIFFHNTWFWQSPWVSWGHN